MPFGTLSVSDTLASASNTIVADFGEEKAFQELSRFLVAHNQIMSELLGSLCAFSADRQRRYGEVIELEMQDAGEFHTPEAQKVTPGATVGFPLKRYEMAIQWTRDWFLNHTVDEMVGQFDAALAADRRRVVRDIKRAIFNSSNFTHSDYLVDRVDLAVKRLLNGDGQPVPISAEGVTFDASTHTHYLARAGGALANSDVVSLIEHVVEHGFGNNIKIYINRAQQSAIEGFADFAAYTEARIINAPGGTAELGAGTFDTSTLYNKAIGIFKPGAEVWVKPWMPADYQFCFDAGSAAKPLVYRNRRATGGAAPLEFIADIELYPLRARAMLREFGIGVWNRANGAVMFSGDTTYADPTLND